jgi:hypothetical protein
VNRESSQRRDSVRAYGAMSVPELLNLGHAALSDVHSGPLQRPARARTAAIAGELLRRGEEADAALLRGYRHTAMRAPAVQWTKDHAGRLIPVALPEAYRSRAPRARRTGRATR